MEIRGRVALVDSWESPVSRACLIRPPKGWSALLGWRYSTDGQTALGEMGTKAVIQRAVGRPVSPRRYTICRHQRRRSASQGKEVGEYHCVDTCGLLTSFLHR